MAFLTPEDDDPPNGCCACCSSKNCVMTTLGIELCGDCIGEQYAAIDKKNLT